MSLLELHHQHEGRAAVLIGSGPSLLDTDLTRLSAPGIVTIGTNRVWELPPYKQKRARLSFYTFLDRRIAAKACRPEVVRLLKVAGATWVVENRHRQRVNATAVDNVVFFRRAELPGTRVRSRIPCRGMETKEYLSDEQPRLTPVRSAADGLVVTCTVLMTAFHLALILGCDSIVLIGADCGFGDPERRHAFSTPPDERSGPRRDVVEANGVGDWPFATKALLRITNVLDAAYHEWKGVRALVNASPRTNLSSWPRRDLSEVLAESR